MNGLHVFDRVHGSNLDVLGKLAPQQTRHLHALLARPLVAAAEDKRFQLEFLHRPVGHQRRARRETARTHTPFLVQRVALVPGNDDNRRPRSVVEDLVPVDSEGLAIQHRSHYLNPRARLGSSVLARNLDGPLSRAHVLVHVLAHDTVELHRLRKEYPASKVEHVVWSELHERAAGPGKVEERHASALRTHQGSVHPAQGDVGVLAGVGRGVNPCHLRFVVVRVHWVGRLVGMPPATLVRHAATRRVEPAHGSPSTRSTSPSGMARWFRKWQLFGLLRCLWRF